MSRHAMVGIVVLALAAGAVWAADKDVKGTVVKVDMKNKTVTIKTADGDKTFEVNDETKFIGPKGGPADDGLRDDRLVAGASVKLVIAGNNKTAREVHLPERKKGK